MPNSSTISSSQPSPSPDHLPSSSDSIHPEKMHHSQSDSSISNFRPSDRFRAALSNVDIRVVSAMLLNFTSSVSIVVLNKIAMDKYLFKFATTLTFFHLVCTFLLLLLSARLGVFEIKRLPIRDVSKLAAGTMAFICLTNLSLQHNSIGFYQVMKVMTTPSVVFLESVLYQKYLDNNLKLSLVPVCIGVIITVYTDFRLNLTGTIYAVAGVITTSFYQIWSGTLQKSLECNALQLQTYVAPLAALFIIPFVPFFDNWSTTDLKSIWYYNFNLENTIAISITGFFGFLVNVSIFLVIGRSSALSYNILGHCKTVVVLISDFLFFSRPFNFKSNFGIILTLLGVFWYTSLKLEKTRIEKESRERASVNEEKQQLREEDRIELVSSNREK